MITSAIYFTNSDHIQVTVRVQEIDQQPILSPLFVNLVLTPKEAAAQELGVYLVPETDFADQEWGAHRSV